MSFKENTYQQLSLTDSFSVLTPREQKALEKSWAKVFADEIFPAIDENRFSVLYSDKASGPNTPFADGCAGRKDCYGGRWCIQRLRCPAGHKPRSCSFMKHSKTMPDSGTEWKRFRRMSAKNYHLEKLPRGKQRGKFFFGAKIAALNFRKLFNYRKGRMLFSRILGLNITTSSIRKNRR